MEMKVVTDITKELYNIPLDISGDIPHWLQGTLVRNGPINFSIDGRYNLHWFDGLAMLHAFTFANGSVHYSNKFLRSDAYDAVFKHHSFDYPGFANDPCRTLFKRFFTFLISDSTRKIPNANINIAKIAEQYVALTETPLPVLFDPITLDTLGVLKYNDHLPQDKCWESAHPHYDEKQKCTISYLVKYGLKSSYIVYHVPENSNKRTTISEIAISNPSYMHTFAVTQNYIIFTEFPFRVKPLDFISSGKAFINNFVWQPELGTQFIVIERDSGKEVYRGQTPAFFAFHHINAYEENEFIHLDIVCYQDIKVIEAIADLYKKNFSHQLDEAAVKTQVMRFSLSLKTHAIHSKVLFEKTAELPRINPQYDGLPYQFMYLCDVRDGSSEQDRACLYKIDNTTKKYLKWSDLFCYPGEPVFIPMPNAVCEDDGVVMSVVFEQKNHRSFLLILDAKTFTELGRSYVPHAILGGLHGQYI